ncbi:MAG: cation:proton antiporter [Chthoniobacterales bacterium]|nr:cation:proton antiporter [Chthoniobacterales bacterium]
MQRTVWLYLLIIGAATLGLITILHFGRHQPVPGYSGNPVASKLSQHKVSSAQASLGFSVEERLLQNAQDPLSRFFLQLFAVITISYSVGWLFTRCGQPAVVGEMMAGVLLGPSLFGLLAPGAFQYVFAPSSLEPLHLLSQIGVCLFMFAVGMEMDWVELREKASAAILISHTSIAIPSLLGAGVACLLYERLAQTGAPFVPFALFVAISMSITAFPVLVRILQDRRILKTPLGRIASACAAVGDVTAWGLLAFVVAIARSADSRSAIFCLCMVLVFVAVMFVALKPNLPGWLGREALERPKPSKGVLAIVIAIVLASALCTQLLGIRALFGSFVAGLIMPTASGFRGKLGVRIENISSVLLLPVFFAFSGLRTEIGLLHDRSDWLICLLIIAVATIGKLGGSSLAARLTGMKWRESFQLGALMNTRGLMELIALNLGYELHILSQRVFSMLVLMALVTTIMTGPLLSLFGHRRGGGVTQAQI